MKVLQINTVSGTGSTGRIVTDLATELNKQGDLCDIAYGQYNSTYTNSYKIGSKIENHLHNIGSRLFDKQGFFSSAGTEKLIAHIKINKPDIIHLHNLHGNYLNITILFNFLANADIPVVWTLHDCWPFTGHCAYFDYIDCHKWETQCDKCPNIHAYPSSILFDSSKDNFEKKKHLFNQVKNMTIVTPSVWLAGLVKQAFLSKYDVLVINNGIDTTIFKERDVESLRKTLGIKNEIILLGVSAEGFEGRKGLTYFIELADKIGRGYKLVLIGCSKADKSKLPGSVIALNRTESTAQLAEYYSLADIFVNPTLEDNYPTTNLEALACGTPIITFDTGGSPEVVSAKTGIIVNKMDSKALVNAVITMNRQFKMNCKSICRNLAVDLYDKKIMYQKYIQLYTEKANLK